MKNIFEISLPIIEFKLLIVNEIDEMSFGLKSMFISFKVKERISISDPYLLICNVNNEKCIYWNKKVLYKSYDEKVLLGYIYQMVSYPYCNRDDWMFLHGSAILYKNSANIFLAKTGMGKTTTVKFLCDNGYEYLSDDLIPINKKKLDVAAYPLPICSRDNININMEKNYIPLILNKKNEKEKKYLIHPKRYADIEKTYDINAIFILNRSVKTEKVELQKIDGSSAFKTVLNNLSIFCNISETGKNLSKIVKQANVYIINYNNSFEYINMIYKIMKGDT